MSWEDFSKGSSSGTMEPTSRTSPGAASIDSWATSGAPNGHKILEDGTPYVSDVPGGGSTFHRPRNRLGGGLELLGRRQLNDLSSEVTPLADGLLDGITVDGDGNLYVAVHGDGRIFVISPEGEVLRDRGRVPWGQGITS